MQGGVSGEEMRRLRRPWLLKRAFYRFRETGSDFDLG
jgi:hypothetical protein